MTVFFTSDLHLGHRAVLDICSRPFCDVKDMNAQLIENINRRVAVSDTLWILGNVSYRISRREAEKWLQRIKCRDIRLLRGNHDRDWTDSNIFTEVSDYRELRLDGRRICLMHYPITQWNGMHYGSIHLHGHSHNGSEYNLSNMEKRRMIWDVGVDTNDYAPVSWEDIRNALMVDVG
ncbi:metallophosphoesterase family protein [Adlercreutzia sp. ZJ154]|uniref:metallophosphoesterase family protein n=1 Tax=Adlercreutzia sp. ZJ154 TaxID=2709790 RepID=UPI0013EA8A4E|nr:metallophosphoesterase family protein [Adlercreutzia sp. ZJ154]